MGNKKQAVYPSDVGDEEWGFVEPYLALCRKDARQREHSLRAVFNGLHYIVKAGNQWRMMPHDLPPWPVVYQQTQRWIRAGCFEIIVEDLRSLLREFAGRKAKPTAMILDVIKEQLTRLAGCSVRLGMVKDGQAVTVKSDVISTFSVWLEKDVRQRVLWPSIIQLDPRYFDSLQRHAVPLDAHHLAVLSHSAMALDVYSWLTQRLHRIDHHKAAFVPWVSVSQQFGMGYDEIRMFRHAFKVALSEVQAVYREAPVKPGTGGLTLCTALTGQAQALFDIRGQAAEISSSVRRRLMWESL